MSKKITKSGKTLFQNTMRMVNFSNRLKEENLMWRKYNKIKKRKLDESEDSDDNLAYENRYFRDKDDSMQSANNSMRMDISMRESNNLSNLKHLNESDVQLRKKIVKTPTRTPSSRTSAKKDKTPNKRSKESDETSDSEPSSDEECMIDDSFSSVDDNKLIKASKSTKTAHEKIKLREKLFKKQMDKLKKKEKKSKKKKKKSKKHKK